MAKLVFSYSHADEDLRNELEKHLSPLKRMGQISTWHDRRIVPGEEFEGEISQHFEDADVILLLVSPDFIASDYCYEIEMTRALLRHEAGEATVIPVVLRACVWHQLPFGKLLAATPDGKPITKYADLDEGFVLVVEAVTRALKKRESNLTTTTVPGTPASPNLESKHGKDPGPRTSNLAIRKEFTDRDRDLACRKGFEFLCRFFENSLEELSARYSELETDFRRRDLDSFECSVYKNGDRVSQCGIWRSTSGFGLGDICYNEGGISTNSCNEGISVRDNGNIIGFEPMMNSFFVENEDRILTNEGMAEHFWDMFIRPLK